MDADLPPPAYTAVPPSTTILGTRKVDVVAVIDTSGSMQQSASAGGEAIGISKLSCAFKAVELLAAISDRLAVVTYDREAEVRLPMRGTYGPVDVSDLRENIVCGGWTNIAAGVNVGFAQVDRASEAVQLVVLLTDGQANAGEQTAAGLGALVARHIAEHPNAVFCTAGFGKGDQISPDALHAMAAVAGAYVNIPDATSLGTGFAHLVAACRVLDATGTAFRIHEPADAALPPAEASVAVADALAKLVSGRPAWPQPTTAESHARLATVMGPVVGMIPGLDVDLGKEIGPGYTDAYDDWGQAYLMALELAYRRRMAITHFDRGTATFRTGNPVLQMAYDQYAAIYERLGVPEPDAAPALGVPVRHITAMTALNDASGGCVHPDTNITLATGGRIKARDVRPGTALLGGVVSHVLRTANPDGTPWRCQFCSLWDDMLKSKITPWHPVGVRDGRHAFPAHLTSSRTTIEVDQVVTFELEGDGTHYDVYGIKVLALNAGIRDGGPADHPFWGTDAWRRDLNLVDGVATVKPGSMRRAAAGCDAA